MILSVLISTHNPNPVRFRRTLEGLRNQTLSPDQYEVVVVDNGSGSAIQSTDFEIDRLSNARVVYEPRLGLIFGRVAGIQNSSGELVVFLDDDIVLARDYLERVIAVFDRNRNLGGAIGKSIPEFEAAPEAWTAEFHGCLGLWNHGEAELTSGTIPSGQYPSFAGGGGGAAFRRETLKPQLAELTGESSVGLAGRTGKQLTSGEDNHIVLNVIGFGWHVGYFPTMSMTHLIPAGRTTPKYLARLNRGIARSWVRVLDRHGIRPWPPVSRWTVPLRKWRAYLSYKAWAGPAEYVRWQGACGQFEGRADIAGGGR